MYAPLYFMHDIAAQLLSQQTSWLGTPDGATWLIPLSWTAATAVGNPSSMRFFSLCCHAREEQSSDNVFPDPVIMGTWIVCKQRMLA